MGLFSPQLNPNVKPAAKSGWLAAPYHSGMDDIYGIRRRNLARVLAEPVMARARRNLDKAANLGLSPSMFSQLIHPEYKIGDDMARKIEAEMGLEAGWMDNAPQSQSVTFTADKLGIALVAVDRAARSRGLIPEEAWGTLAPLVLWAVGLQEQHYPDGVKDLRGFDAQVLLELNGGNYGFGGDGKAEEGRSGAAGETTPPRQKARGSR